MGEGAYYQTERSVSNQATTVLTGVHNPVLIIILFAFTRFFKLQNIVKNRVHFNTC